MPIAINLTTQFSYSSSERRVECEELTGDRCSAVNEFNTKISFKVYDGLPDNEKGSSPTGISERNITIWDRNYWEFLPVVQKIRHLLIVTVVPVARFKIKLVLAGTVKPLIVIVVHLTALATSVNVRTIPCYTNNSLGIPDKELMVAEQPAFTKVAPKNNNKKTRHHILNWNLNFH